MFLPEHILTDLQKREELNSLRSVVPSKGVDFASNDYLGLANNSELQNKIKSQFDKSMELGATGSRLISGTTRQCLNLEKNLAKAFAAESALLFSSGYMANLGLLSCIAKKDDTILYDERAHASIKDGARLSLAKKLSFKHNHPGDLERKLGNASGNKFVVVESIYSMDGDFCDFHPILEVCEKNNALLIVDEAHSTGIYGDRGSGLVAEQQLEGRVFARVFTFGKAFGLSGACIAGSKGLTQYLVNFSRPFIYTTASSAFHLTAIQESLNFIQSNSKLVDDLNDNIRYFKTKVGTTSETPIQPVLISGIDNLKKAAKKLEQNGLDVKPILSPTVPLGTERLRICLHSFNSKKEIDLLASLLT